MNSTLSQKGDEFSLNLQNTISQNESNYIHITNMPISKQKHVNVFSPKENLFYCYFTESDLYKKSTLSVKDAIDIQRFCYYPKTSNVYTFIGFSTQNLRDRTTRYQKLIKYSVNKIIYKYVRNYQEILNFFNKNMDKNTQNKNYQSRLSAKESKKYKEFNPKKKLTYFYFHEQKKTDVERLKNLNHPIYHIYTAQDVQLYCFYPGTTKLYSFFGFLNKEEGIQAFKSSKSVMENYLIRILSASKLNKKNLSSSDTEKVELFRPNEKFFYLYFKEIKLNENKKFDGVDGITDLQRNRRINSGDSNCYTFLGFLHSFQRICAFKILKNKTNQIDTKSLKMIDDDDEDNSEYDEENEISRSKKGNSKLNGNSNISKPIENSNNSKPIQNSRFHYSPDLDSNSIDISPKSDKKKSKQFVYIPEQNNKSETVNSITSEKVEKTQSKIENNKQKISPSLLPKFNGYQNLGFSFKTFVPKENLLYCFLAEVNKPSYRSVYDKFDQLFGVTNASDIQRFRFYPATENVYTFVGFSDQSKLNQSIQKSSFRSAAINCQIFNFPYEKAIIKNEENTQNLTKTQPKLTRKVRKSKFVYNPDSEKQSNKTSNIDSTEIKKSDKNINIKNDKISQQGNDSKDKINEFKDTKEKNEYKNSIVNNNNNNDNNNADDDNDVDDKEYKINQSSKLNNNNNNNATDDDDFDDKEYKINQSSKFNNNNNDDDDDECKINQNTKFDVDDFDFNLNENDVVDQIDNSLFDQDEDINYLFFKEKNSEVRNLHLKNAQLFGINNIIDLQRGYHLRKGDANFYTFLGFSRCIDVCSAYKILKEKEDEIEISTLQFFDNDEGNVDDDDDDDDDDEVNCEDGDEILDFDEIFDSDEVIQNIHRNEKVAPKEKINF